MGVPAPTSPVHPPLIGIVREGGETWRRWYLALILFSVGMMLADQTVTFAYRAKYLDPLQEKSLRLVIYTSIAITMMLFALGLPVPRLRRLLIAASVVYLTARFLDLTATIESLAEVPLLGDSAPLNSVTRRVISRIGFGLLIAGFALTALELSRANHTLQREILERQRLEAQLLQSQKLTAMGELAGGIAHNFNNLLTVIVGNLDLVRHETSPAVQGKLHEALRASSRAADLVRQLLAFGRQVPPAVKPIDVTVMLDEAAQMARSTFDARIAIHVESRPDVWAVMADASQLHQVLLNLCLNARDALREVPAESKRPLQIRLTVCNVVADAARESTPVAARGKSFVRIAVTDTGCGMDAQTQARIFDPFFTTKEIGKGTGLGLSTVHGIVTRHEGWVEVDSAPGEGSTFSAYFPRAEREPIGVEPAPATAPVGGPTILVADDDVAVRNVTAMILIQAGYRVLIASDGLEAVAAYREAKGSISLALLDASMPGLTGLEALQLMREHDPRLKALLFSGNAPAWARPGERSDWELLDKPFTSAVLLAAVRRALDQ